MNINSIYSQNFISKFTKKSSSRLEQLQAVSFMLYTCAIVIGISVNLLGLSGPQETSNLILNSCFLLSTLLIILLYITGKLSAIVTFNIMAITFQTFTCTEMILCALFPSEYNLMLIVGNMVLLVTNISFSLISYQKNIPLLLSLISIGTYIYCGVITQNAPLLNFIAVYCVIIAFILLFGTLMRIQIKRLNDENNTLKHNETEILQVLHTDKEQITTYSKLSQRIYDNHETENLLDILDEKARNNIIENVKNHIIYRSLEKIQLSDIFPELTPSEIEICRLIIMNKSLSEVCDILGKSESNITCQRSNIRKKLGLHSTENLKLVLQTRFKNAHYERKS